MYLHEYNNVMYNQPIGYKAYYLTILKKIKKNLQLGYRPNWVKWVNFILIRWLKKRQRQ
jgi:hypothetical protein